jgi:lipopolysaccharide transport system ATP-binding protein
MSSPAIRVENLGKCFKFYPNKWRQLSGAILGSGNHAQELWALRNLNFQLERGSTLGIMGANGSGKTTLLQLIAGLLKPTEGVAEVNGTLATLLELGSGFQFDLTGRENIFVTGGLKGFSRREIQASIDDIIAFSELKEFIDRPIKHYSTGMMMRLAFATAINVQPEVLLVDEVFAVGDIAFQHKCIKKFRELQKNGATVILVSHDLTAIKSLCDSAILLDRGIVQKHGNTEDVSNFYLNLVSQKFATEDVVKTTNAPNRQWLNFTIPENAHRHGTGEARICGVQILNSKLMPVETVTFGEEVTFRFFLEYLSDVPESGLGFYVRDRYGNDILGINTFEEGRVLGIHKAGDRLIIDFQLPIYFRPGSYSVSPGFSRHRMDPNYLDWIDNAAFFELTPPSSGKIIHGLVHVPNQVAVMQVKE